MRALAAAEFGRPDALAVCDMPVPDPSEGEVRLRVQATGLGYVDGLIAAGRYQLKPPLPYIPGAEVVGVVDALGPQVGRWAVGDRVASWQLARGGGVAEFAIATAAHLVPVPDSLPSPAAAAMMLDYVTAQYALFDRGNLTADDIVLVLGAAGGVAAAAVQLAAKAGARVIAAASSAAKRGSAMTLGAEATVDYILPGWRDELRRLLAGRTVDIVVDPVGGAATELAFRSLGKGGRHLVLGFASGEIPALPTNLPLLKSASLVGVDVRSLFETDFARVKQILVDLFARAGAGALTAPVVQIFALEQAKVAFEGLMRRSDIGKKVIVPAV